MHGGITIIIAAIILQNWDGRKNTGIFGENTIS